MAPPATNVSLVPGPDCHDNLIRVCYHGPAEAIMHVAETDPFAHPCWARGLAKIVNTTCQHNNFTLYIGQDPLYTEAGLYLRKA